MSYIDSFDHEFVGYFAGRPLYHPLENIPGNTKDVCDFECSTEHLVLGGGSGEHPGLVIEKPSGTVAKFIDNCDQFDLNDDAEFQLLDAQYANDIFLFAGWDSQNHHEFYTACMSNAMPCPFHPDLNMSFEDWLGCSIGEFIFFAMPELARDLIAQYAPHRRGTPRTVYNNILLPTPGGHSFANGGYAFTSTRRQNKK